MNKTVLLNFNTRCIFVFGDCATCQRPSSNCVTCTSLRSNRLTLPPQKRWCVFHQIALFFDCFARATHISPFVPWQKVQHRPNPPLSIPLYASPRRFFPALSTWWTLVLPMMMMIPSRCGTCSFSWLLSRLTRFCCGSFGVAKGPRRSARGRCAPPWRSMSCRWSLLTSPGTFDAYACDCFRPAIVCCRCCWCC